MLLARGSTRTDQKAIQVRENAVREQVFLAKDINRKAENRDEGYLNGFSIPPDSLLYRHSLGGR